MIKLKHILIVLAGFPLIYVLNNLTPWSIELFAYGNGDFYIPFWSSVIVLHWISFFIVKRFLKKENKTLKDIGYGLNTKRTLLVVLLCLAVALLVFTFTEMTLDHVAIDPNKLAALPIVYPKTISQRLVFIMVAFTAGFCEEIVYRGFAITKLAELGINRWLALIPAGISFVFVHGLSAIFGGWSQFLFYFAAAMVFGVIYLSTKKLLPGMIIHYLWDLMTVMATFQAIAN